jgi:hypothetical protein
MTVTAPEWLTRAQFAAALQVHPRTVSRWIAADTTMRVQRLGPTGHRVRIHRSELERRAPEQPDSATTAIA